MSTLPLDQQDCSAVLKHAYLQRIRCILTYGGSIEDIWINYLLLAVNFVWCLLVAKVLDRRRERRERQQIRRFRLASLVKVVVFQIILCLRLGCQGISIVWCAMAGWALRNEYCYEISYQLWAWLINGVCVSYYAVVLPPITTVAHFCALGLGYLLSYLESSLPEMLTVLNDDYQPVQPASQ